MKNLIKILTLILTLHFSLALSAQKVLQRINAVGYEYKAIKSDSLFVIPQGGAPALNGYSSTPGALYLMIYEGDTSLMVYTGTRWKKVGEDSVYVAGNGIEIDNYQIKVDTFVVATKDRVMEVADSLSVVMLPKDEVRDSVVQIGDPRYLQKRDSLVFDLPLETYRGSGDSLHVRAKVESNVWNAGSIMGIPVEAGTPADGSTLIYSQSANRWMHSISLSYNNTISATYASYKESKMMDAMRKMFDYILELEKRIEALEKK